MKRRGGRNLGPPPFFCPLDVTKTLSPTSATFLAYLDPGSRLSSFFCLLASHYLVNKESNGFQSALGSRCASFLLRCVHRRCLRLRPIHRCRPVPIPIPSHILVLIYLNWSLTSALVASCSLTNVVVDKSFVNPLLLPRPLEMTFQSVYVLLGSLG